MKCIVKTPIRHDGKDYAEGASITLSDEQAQELAAVDAVSIVETAEAAEAKTKK